MKNLVAALKSPEGKAALIRMIAGILVSGVGGFLLKDLGIVSDISVLGGTIFTMVGAEQLCRLIIHPQSDEPAE